MKIPAFLLRRLYVKGSLAATPTGFEFQISNKLGSGYARGLLPLTVDGEELDMSETTFEIDGKVTSFDVVSNDTPFTLAMNKTTTIAYTGGALPEGPHKVGMRFQVAGLGELGFDFSDTASAKA
jgi:hypothetical protein